MQYNTSNSVTDNEKHTDLRISLVITDDNFMKLYCRLILEQVMICTKSLVLSSEILG